MILVFRTTAFYNFRLCQDDNWRSHAAFGGERSCVRVYKNLAAALKKAKRVKGCVAVIPPGLTVDASGGVIETIPDPNRPGWELTRCHSLDEYIVVDDPVTHFIAIAPLRVAYQVKPKQLFHKLGEQVLRLLANALGYKEGDYDLRHNLGGIAVSGEITLHSDNLYIQFAQSSVGHGDRFMWRTCNGRKDYVGNQNQWMTWCQLADLPHVANIMKAA